jgi:hypothetical protein
MRRGAVDGRSTVGFYARRVKIATATYFGFHSAG